MQKILFRFFPVGEMSKFTLYNEQQKNIFHISFIKPKQLHATKQHYYITKMNYIAHWTCNYHIKFKIKKAPHIHFCRIEYLVRLKAVDEINSLRDCLKYRANLTGFKYMIFSLLCLRFYPFTEICKSQNISTVYHQPRKKWVIFN